MQELTIDVDVSGFDGELVPFVVEASQKLRKAESDVGRLIWDAGQALTFAFQKCKRGEWPIVCQRIKVSETRALQYRNVFEKFSRDQIPNVGKQLLLELAPPSVPATVIESIATRADAGEAPSVREAKAEIAEAKSQTSAEFDHDKDRTTQEPELATGGLEPKRAKQLLRAIATATQKSVNAGVSGDLVRDFCNGLALDVSAGSEIVGIDDATLNGVLRQQCT